MPCLPTLHLRQLLAALTLSGAALATQASPASFTPDLAAAARAPSHTLAPPDIAKSAAVADNNGRPPRVALGLPITLSLADGAWTREGDTAVWRMQLDLPGATFVTLNFDEYQLPASAKLYLYDPEGTLVQGPLTAADATAGTLWTPLTRGERSLVELRVPASEQSQVQLQLAKAYYGVGNLSNLYVEAKSASCNVDVVCPAGNDWRDQIRATALMVFAVGNDLFACSGSLLNNTTQNKTPYFLTAHHCGVNAGNDDTVVTYWNYQTSLCGGTPDGSLAQYMVGSIYEDSDESTDYTLLQLRTTPPSAYNVFFAGWDATGATPQSGVAIHHPQGDEKRISTYSTPATKTTIQLTDEDGNDLYTVDTWGVSWSQGTTEPGSSGSGLYNQNQRIVGVLSGGNASCSNSDGSDYFGRLDLAWNSGLKNFLDPANTGAKALCGTNPGTTCDTDGDDDGDGGGGAAGPGLLAVLGAAALLRRRRSR